MSSQDFAPNKTYPYALAYLPRRVKLPGEFYRKSYRNTCCIITPLNIEVIDLVHIVSMGLV